MDIDIDMDEGPAPIKEQVNRRNDILESVQDWVMDSDTMDIANERSLDWIWSVVGQLRLKSVIANDMLLAKDGNLQGPTSSFDLASAMNQRLVVGNILAQVITIDINMNWTRLLNIFTGNQIVFEKTSKKNCKYMS